MGESLCLVEESLWAEELTFKAVRIRGLNKQGFIIARGSDTHKDTP